MTIHSQIRRAGPYTSSIGSNRLPFSFKVFKESDLLVLRIDTEGKAATLSLSSDYAVELNDNQDVNPGGVVVLASAIPAGQKVLISSNIPYLQLTDLQNQGGFHPKVIVRALDKLTILIQQIVEQLSWSGEHIVVPPQDGGDNSGTWIQRGLGAVRRTVQAKLRETVSVTDFMTVEQIAEAKNKEPSGDYTAAIQAAINSGAKRISSPAGLHYRITKPLVIKADNVVLDFSMSTLLLDDPSGKFSHLLVGDESTQINGVRIQNITFARAQAATAGAAVDMRKVGLCKVTGCRIYGNRRIYTGVSIFCGMICEISDNYIDYCIKQGIYLEGLAPSPDRTMDATIHHNRVEGGTGLSVWSYVEGLFCRDNIFFNCNPACVSINAEPGKGLVSFKLQNNDFDTSTDMGLYIDNVKNIQVTGCWFASVRSGLVLGSATDGAVISGNQMYCSGHGIQAKGESARINDNLISGGDSCVYVGASARHTSIVGNSLGNANYGINMGESPSGTHAVGNHIFNMALGTVLGETGGSDNILSGNKGDAAVGAAGYIAVGSSPFTYTAGPRPEFVTIFGGTLNAVKVGDTDFGTADQTSLFLAARQSVTIQYSAKPYMVRNTQ